MAEKIEGYRKRDEEYSTLKPKEVSKEMKPTSPSQGSSMQEFMNRMETKSIEDHTKEISSGRGNGIPDNYKKKTK